MKTDSVVQTFSGRKQSLIEDARRERSSGGGGSAGSPGPSRYGDGFVFEEKEGRVTLNVLFALSNEKNAGFFKTGKIFEVSLRLGCENLRERGGKVSFTHQRPEGKAHVYLIIGSLC